MKLNSMQVYKTIMKEMMQNTDKEYNKNYAK